MSPVVTAPRRTALRSGRAVDYLRSRDRRLSADFLVGLGLTAALGVLAWVAAGGVDLAPNTWVQLALVALGAVAAVAVALIGRHGHAWGAGALLLFGALAALTYGSIAWSVQPATSWLEANRTLSYLAAFGAALAGARLFPDRWRAVVGAIGAAAVLLSAYALLVKVFPGALGRNDPLGRLRAPFDYWNAVGLMAAMGIPAALWAGARREHTPLLRALAVPAIAILLPALLLSYSRGALAVAVIGTALWFALVPLRLRGAVVLALGLAGGAVSAIWALSTHSIYADSVALGARISSGHTFGLVLLVVLVLTTAAGFAAAFAMDSFALSPAVRHRTGVALIALTALIPVGGVAALAASKRGFTGEVSHIWTTLTSTRGVVGDQPGRLVDLSNSRPTYWRDGFKVGEHHLLAGVGARGFQTAELRYATNTWPVDAHSYLIETFADFGLIGVTLTLALLGAWTVAAGRTLGLGSPGGAPESRGPPAAEDSVLDDEQTGERAGLLTLLAVVVAFGVSSLIDWTWFIPGTAVPALVAAGWLAGRGPLRSPVGRRTRRRLTRSPGTALVVTSVAALTLIAIWAIVQPLRSSDALDSASAALVRGDTAAALTDARSAAAADPVSVDPRFVLSAIYSGLGNRRAARSELVQATSTQPSNPETWIQLGCYDLSQTEPGAASELLRAFALEPSQTELRTDPAAFCAGVTGA